MRVLIVKISAFGDVIHALPVLPIIKKRMTEWKIYWGVDEQFSDLLEGNPFLDGIIPLPIRLWKKKFGIHHAGDALRVIRSMRALNFDVCLDIQGNLKSGAVTYLSGAEERYGFDRGNVRERPNLLFTNRKVSLREGDRHIFQKILRVVSAWTGEVEEDFQLYPSIFFPDGLREEIRARMEVEKIRINIAVHHGTTWETKRLSHGRWISLLSAVKQEFEERGLRLYFTWGDFEEKEKCRGIINGLGDFDGAVLMPSLTIKELGAFFSSMDLVIGPDTGPIHLAAASGAKTLSFYRVTLGERNAPLGPSHRYIQAKVDCTGCLRKECEEAEKCESGITVEEFVGKAKELIGM